MIKKVVFCAMVSVAGPSLVLAAEDPAELSLEDLVKTDITSVSRKSRSLADVPAAAFVITTDDIRRSGARACPTCCAWRPA
ncbi:MAG: hypothetical protein V9G12_01440 [Microthrixaceae bacterium]